MFKNYSDFISRLSIKKREVEVSYVQFVRELKELTIAGSWAPENQGQKLFWWVG